MEERTGSRLLSVFIPTVPNPTTGYLVFVPVEQVTVLEISVEEAFKMLLSVGVIIPDKKKKPDRTETV